MGNNVISERTASRGKAQELTLFKDVLTEDDRALLENNGLGLETLPLCILSPKAEELGKDFNGDENYKSSN